MARQFFELRERLLRAGIAPRHVRRYLTELGDHLADLTAEEQCAGRTPADAEAAALARLGGVEELANAMLERRRMRSWSARAPWSVFGVAPVVLVALGWVVALSLLWEGWQVFLPAADSPFGRRPGTHRIFELANLYFQLDRAIFFGAPILIGWAICLVAARQRSSVAWPAAGVLTLALLGGAAQVHAVRMAATAGRHVGLSFTFAHFATGSYGLVDTLTILTLTVLPYLAWRWKTTRLRHIELHGR